MHAIDHSNVQMSLSHDFSFMCKAHRHSGETVFLVYLFMPICVYG